MVSDDQLREAMDLAMKGFVAAVAMLEPQHWDLPTPCSEWSVFDVVDHVVAGDHFTALTLNGASVAVAAEAMTGLDATDPDLVAQVDQAAAAARLAFEGSLDRTIAHRIGPVAARRVLGFRIIDQLGHTWDLAAATGFPAAIDARALALAVDLTAAERTTLADSANFATLPDDPDLAGNPLKTFLHAIGRTP